MTYPPRVLFYAALPILLSAAGPAALGADAQIQLGNGHVAEVDSRGVLKILKGEAVLIRQVFLGTWIQDEFSDQCKAVKTAGAERGGMIVRSGLIPRPGTSAKYEAFIRATPPGADGFRDLLLTYVVDTPLLADVKAKAKAGLLFRFPVAEFANKSVFVDNVSAGVFPEKQGGKTELALRRGARNVMIKADKKVLLFIGRQDAGQILVQDSRKWGADAYEAQLDLAPTRSQPPSRRVLNVILSLSGQRGPILAKLETNRPPGKKGTPSALPKYGRLEISMDLWAQFTNQYDAKDIEVTGVFTRPDKTTKAVRGFFYQAFERDLIKGQEKLTPLGPHQWRVRFTPTEVGLHTFVVTVKTGAGQMQSKPRTFYVARSETPGFISVHKVNKRYFQFSNGKTFFLVGHNVCWGSEEKLSYDYDAYFRRMGNAGENYTRVWMCSWDTGIEGDRLDHYRLDAAWRLDYVLQLAEQRGIYVKLCLDNEHDYTTPEKQKHFGIWKKNGGPCGKVLDFFTLPVAKAAYKRRLDYILARWGHSPHVMAWELWNEMNYIESTNSKAREILIDWTEEIAEYVKKNDPFQHLVTTSLGLLTVWDEMWELDNIDFAQIHAYLPKPEDAKKPEQQDAVLAVLRAGERVAKFGKPYHVSEFGYLDLPAVTRTNEKDPTGIHLHNAIWGSLFSGAAGAPAIWWWQDYVHEKNLYRHYASVARFVHDIDLADKTWKRMVAAGTSKVRIIGVKKSDRCALWIQRRGNHWYRRVAQEKPLEPLGKVKLRVPDVISGKYRITWWDPYAGEITHYPQLAVRRKTDPTKFDLVLEYTTGQPDIAVKAEKVQ